MARGNNTQAVINITTNATKAQNDIEKLDQLLKKLNQTKKLMEKDGQTNTAAYKKLKQDIKSATEAQKENISAQERMNRALKNINDLKLKNLKREYRLLAQELGNFSGKEKAQAEQWRRNLDKIKGKIAELEGTTKKFGATHGSIWSTAVRNITAFVGVFGAFNAIKSKLSDFLRLNKEFSDQLANVRKVSNLTMGEISQLSNRLSKVDSRTSLSGLMDLSYTGAKLGFGEYGIEGLESFAKSAVKVQNALKEDMGEESLTALSKMVEVMGLIPKMGVERAMDATGSAIFRLASTSTATGTNIVEFSKRLMGLANTAHIATPDLLAFGSAADSMALMPEVAATAFNKLITAVQKQPNLIEKSLNIQPGTISNLYQANKMTEALVLIFEKMREKGGMNALMNSGVFKDLGSDGARLVAVMATMSNRVDILNKHLAESRAAFADGTAVAKEYEIQMDTAAAYAERSANLWEKAFVNPEGVDMVKALSKAWFDVSKSLTDSQTAMGLTKIALYGLLYAVKGLLLILPELIGAAGIGGVWMAITKLRQGEGIIAGLTTKFNGLTAAQKAFWKAAGWAGLALAIYEVGKAIYDVAQKTKEASQWMKGFKENLSDVKREQNAATIEVKRYVDAINEAKKGTEQRKAAINNFNRIYGKYLSNMLTEKSTALDVANAYKEVVRQLKAKIALQAKQKDLESFATPRARWTADKLETYDESVSGTGRNVYNGDWLAGFVSDARTAGKNIRQIAEDLNTKVFKLPKNAFENVYQQRGRRQVLAGEEYVERYNPLGDYVVSKLPKIAEKKSPETQLLNAINYALQYYSYDNTVRRIDKKYKPFAKEMDRLTNTEDDEPLNPLSPARDKDAERAAAKAAREAAQARAAAVREQRKQLQQELKEAEQESQAIIDKIEEWYRLQETDVENLVADGKKTRAEADAYLKDLKKSKNKTLANARLSISGKMKKEDWDKYIAAELPKMMADQGEWSSELAQDIINTNLQNIHNLLARFDGSAKVLGVKSTASFDRIEKNAAGNLREIAREDAKIKEEVERILLEYKYVEQAERSFHDNLIGLGIMAETYEQYTKRMKEEAEANKNKTTDRNDSFDGMDGGEMDNVLVTAKRPQTPEEKLLKQFLGNGAKPYGVNIENDRELFVWLKNLMSNYDYDEEDNIMFHEEDWVKGFPQLKQWVDDIDKYRPDIQKFYLSLINWEESYYDAKKKAYDHDKKQQEMRFKVSGEQDEYDRQQSWLETKGKIQDASGGNMNFWQQNGLADAIANDPEVQRIQLRMEWRQKELEDAQAHGAAQELINERQTQLLEEFSNLAAKVSAEVAARVQKIQTLSEPLYSWGEEVGQMLGEQWRGISQDGKLTFAQMTRNMAIEYAKQTLKMASENITKKLQQALFYRQMETMEQTHQGTLTAIQIAGQAARLGAQAAGDAATNAAQTVQDQARVQKEAQIASIMAMFGVSEGAAKIIATLGWWGIPLIGVITAILMGLLSSAKATANTSTSTSTTSTPKTKMVSGMLTYDEGNVSSYVGTDGHAYRASAVDSLPAGVSLVNRPIATTVNGSPALVGERGPEIVIGRKTTRHIMMNEPQLLRAIASVDQLHRGRRLRTFDDGNVSGLLTGIQNTEPSRNSERDNEERERLTAALDQNTQMMAAFVQMMNTIQQRGIPAHIRKYGTGGLIDEVKSGLKFDQRYNR